MSHRPLLGSALTAALVLASLPASAQAPYLVKDIWPGGPSQPYGLVPVGDRVFFMAYTPEMGHELWSSGGTEASTTFVDVTPGPVGFVPIPLFSLGNEVFFRRQPAGAGLWKSDGTSAGTRLLSDLEPDWLSQLVARQPERLLFGANGIYPALTDGTEAGTFLVTPPLGGPPTEGSAFGGAAAFAGGFAIGMEHGYGAWWTDGAGRATHLVPNGGVCESAAAAGGRIFLTCDFQLVVSDGTSSGTQLIGAIPGAVVPPLRAAGDRVFFMVGGSLWSSDGTLGGTQPVPFPGVAPTTLYLQTAQVSNGVLFFGGVTPETGRELWRTDGTAAGTLLLRDIEPGPGSGIEDDNASFWAASAAGSIVFVAQTTSAGMEAWKSDGTVAGTVPLPEIVPGPGSSYPRWFAAAGGRVYFSAGNDATGNELWAVDVPAGAVAVDDVAVEEGDAAAVTASFPVRLESAATVPVVVAYATVAGSAQAGNDFTAQSGTLTFAPGERERTIEVPVLPDAADETNEAFTLVLTPVGGAVMADATAAAVILDDDAPRIRAAGTTKLEGDSSSSPADFVVTVTTEDGGPVAEPITVRYVGVDGTATVGVDYTAQPGTLSFFAGMPSGSTGLARVSVFGDTVDEPNETFQLALDAQNNAIVEGPAAGGLILDDDGVAAARPVELSHGTTVRGDLAPPDGPGPDRDFYVLLQRPETSYELVVDEASGDAAPLTVQRIGADGTTVLQSGVPVGTGTARSLRWINSAFDTISDEHVRVESASCGTVCGTDDTYRVRFYETTLRGARVNTTNGQSTVLLLQNLTDAQVIGVIHFRSENGVNGGGQGYSIPARGTLVHDMSQNLFVPGSLWVTHDAPHGGVAGKVVGLEPATGFGFDTPLTSRPR